MKNMLVPFYVQLLNVEIFQRMAEFQDFFAVQEDFAQKCSLNKSFKKVGLSRLVLAQITLRNSQNSNLVEFLKMIKNALVSFFM